MNTNSMRTVLVVDDVEMNLQLALRILEGWGLNVVLARNGKEALTIFGSSKIDVILMDIQMPEMDGLEATQHIREYSDVPVIALTANTSVEETTAYEKAGMNDCLPKPIDEKKLFDILSRYMQIELKAPSRSAQQMASAPLYDFKLVEEIAGGDREFVKRMMSMFVDTIPALLSELQYSVENEEWDKTSKIAHRMKSTIDSMNIQSIKSEIRQMEANGKQRANLEAMPSLVEKVSNVLTECFESVRKELR